eukprot:208540-Amphidinium_carterae.2
MSTQCKSCQVPNMDHNRAWGGLYRGPPGHSCRGWQARGLPMFTSTITLRNRAGGKASIATVSRIYQAMLL